MDWNDIIGHHDNIKILRRMLEEGRMPHAFLFTGSKGVGKYAVAEVFARGILCSDTPKPCNTCQSCRLFLANGHPDYMVVAPSGSTIKIEQIREVIHFASLKAVHDSKRVVVIDDADTMTDEAANSLLKILEEPPGEMIFILITGQKDKMLSTIISRCTDIHFYPLPSGEICKALAANNFSQTELAAKISDGCLGAAKQFIELGEVEYRQYACEIIDNAIARKLFAIEAADKYDKFEASQILLVIKFLLYLLRDILVIKYSSNSEDAINSDIAEWLAKKTTVKINSLQDAYKATRIAQHAILFKANMRLTLEELFIKYNNTLGR